MNSYMQVRQRLNTRLIGRGLFSCYDTIDSTNDEAKRLVAKGAPEGSVVLAGAQTQGRGRMCRSWNSPPCVGVYLSVIVRPSIMLAEAPRLTLVSAVAVALALKGLGIKCSIKWPNDIMVGTKKISGILTELCDIQGMRNDAKPAIGEPHVVPVVIGIGVNSGSSLSMFPPELQNVATSVNMIAESIVSNDDLICEILRSLDQWYYFFIAEPFETILSAWRNLSCTLKEEVCVISSAGSIAGEAEDVTSDGSLIVRDAAGRLHTVIAGDVVHCRGMRS
ncbi:MAG: biotin--[acetyl-CoA-carboxylase] ligase [Pseudomonadota bacterium]